MIYLKLIANAAWAGLYAAILVALILFFLNDGLAAGGILSERFFRAVASATILYLPLVALLLPSLFLCIRFFAARRLGTRWASLKSIVWCCAAVLGALTPIAFHNLHWAGALMQPGARELMRAACALMAACFVSSVALAGLAQFREAQAARILRIAAAALLLAPLLVMAALAPREPQVTRAARAQPPPASASESASDVRSMLLIGVDSASMDQILPLISAGDLPAFDRILRDGASARLDTIRPYDEEVSWASIMTGLPPWKSGYRSRRRYALPLGPSGIEVLPRGLGLGLLARWGVVVDEPVASAGAPRPGGPTLWEILRNSGLRADVIGWSGGTVPDPERVAGLGGRVSSRVERILGRPASGDPDHVGVLRAAVTGDLAARAAALEALERRPEESGLLAVRLAGLGQVARGFLRYHQPDEFGDVTPEEEAAWGGVVRGYYRFLDEMLEELVGRMRPDAPVMVVSAYGIAPVSTWESLERRFLAPEDEQGPPPSGSWREGPDGVLLVKGEGIEPGGRMEEAGPLDVAPTVLYALGLPIGRDMRGSLLRQLFRRDWLETHPVHFVPSHARDPAWF